MPLNSSKEAREARFWAKVDRRGADECWHWRGYCGRQGYGIVIHGPRGATRQLKAHRLAYEYATGTSPSDLCVLHKCDNPSCCNPAHLFLGTRDDNNKDKVAKGRQPRHVGEANPRAKLTKADALTIRECLAAGQTQDAVARKFGVHQTQVSRVKRGYLCDA